MNKNIDNVAQEMSDLRTDSDFIKTSMKVGDVYHGEYRADGLRIFSPSREVKTDQGRSLSMKATVLTVSDFFEDPEGLAKQFADILNKAENRPYVERQALTSDTGNE